MSTDSVRNSLESETSVDNVMRKLAATDEKFTHFKYRLGWDVEPKVWEGKALETVNEYISIIKANKDIITPDSLLESSEQMYNLDPVFSVLLRAIKGHSIMTPEVFEEIRGSWCHSDLPDDVDDLIRLQDDAFFVSRFENTKLDPEGNIKLLALQKRGIRDLVQESQKPGTV